MAKKSKHPDKDLLDYLNESLDQNTGRTVQKHLDSCEECSQFASLIRALRQEVRTVAASVSDRELTRPAGAPPVVVQRDSAGPGPVAHSSEIATSFVPSPIDPYSRPGLPGHMPIAGRAFHFHDNFSAHPTAEELASAFYAKPRRKPGVGTASPASAEAAADVAAPVVAHVAVCSDCAGILSAFSRAEMAAVNTDLREASQRELPAWVFKRINEWEQSAFGGQKSAENVISQGMQNRLLELSRTGGHGLHEAIEKHLIHTNETLARPGLVPVIVVDRHGEAQGVEMFRCSVVRSDAQSLEHEEQSTRFHGRRLVAVRNAAAARPDISVSVVRESRATFHDSPMQEAPEKTHYFLVDE